MAKNSVAEYDSDPNNNTDIGGIGIEGTNLPSNFDNALRQQMAHAKDEHDAVYSELDDVNAIAEKNLVINGGFTVNQEGVSGTVTLAVNEYGHDMWKGGSSGCTYTFSTVNGVTTITITAGSLVHLIAGENVESKTYCLNWTGTAQGRVIGGTYADAGTTMTATGGVTFGIEFGTGTVTGVSLIEGTVPGAYRARDVNLEKLLCFPYYEKKTLLKTLEVGKYNDELWRMPKRSTPVLTVSGATFASTYADTEGWNVTVSGATNVFITIEGDARL